jgi:hypothetical protein
MENIILSPIPISELQSIISETVRAEMQQICTATTSPETEFITRQETAKILDISLPTLNEWTKQGIVIGYRINTRVRYKKGEILDAVKQIQTLKYRRGA